MENKTEGMEFINLKIKNIEDGLSELKEQTNSNTKRLNKNDIVLTKIDLKLDNIEKKVTKLDKIQEEKYREAEKNIKDFFKKGFYWIVGIFLAIVLAALGINKFM